MNLIDSIDSYNLVPAAISDLSRFVLLMLHANDHKWNTVGQNMTGPAIDMKRTRHKWTVLSNVAWPFLV